MENTGIKQLKQIREETLAKWSAAGLLTGLEGRVNETVAELFQGQAYIINEEEQITETLKTTEENGNK